MTLANAVYILGGLTSLICSLLLLRGYSRGRKKLLLWSGLCFLGLSIANFVVFLDLVIFPQVDLYPLRLAATVLSMALLLYGLIWESD